MICNMAGSLGQGWLKRDLKITEKVVIAIVAVLVAARILLPYLLKDLINHRLARIGDYSGHVDDVGAHVLHGGYSMHNLVIWKRGSKGNEPFVAAEDVTFTVDYGKLIHGQFVSDVSITNGSMNFKVAAPENTQNLGLHKAAATQAPKPAEPWASVFRDLFPIDLTYLRLKNCRIHYVDATATPRVNLSLNHIQMEAVGLRNRPTKSHAVFPAAISGECETIGGGRLRLAVKLNPLAAKPRFDAYLLLENLSLPSVNSLLAAKADVALKQGYLQLYSEVDADNGSYRGYVKPMLTDLSFKTPKSSKLGPLAAIWKDLVAAASRLIRSKQPKQVATVVPFSGTFSQGNTLNIGALIRNLFHNGFIAALRHGLQSGPSGKIQKS